MDGRKRDSVREIITGIVFLLFIGWWFGIISFNEEVRCVKDKNRAGQTVYYGIDSNGNLTGAPKGCG